MAGPQYRPKLQPRSMQANINSFENRIRRDPDSVYRTHSPAGNQYDTRRFNVVDSRTTQGIRERRVNDGPIDSRTMGFKNTYFTNPTTGNKFGDSMAEGPSGWVETRHIYPDASGYGTYYDEAGNYSEYPIQLKGPQTWNYDPGPTWTGFNDGGWNVRDRHPEKIQTDARPRPNFTPSPGARPRPNFTPGEGLYRMEDPSLPPWWGDNLGSGEGTYWNVRADQPDQSGIMLALSDNPTVNRIQSIYNQVDPFLPEVNWEDKTLGYDYEKDLWGGNLNVGGEYDVDDDGYQFGINWSKSF